MQNLLQICVTCLRQAWKGPSPSDWLALSYSRISYRNLGRSTREPGMQNLEYQQRRGDLGLLRNCHWFTKTFPSPYSSQISLSSKVTSSCPALLRWWNWSRQESPQGVKSNTSLAVDAGQMWQQLLLHWKEESDSNPSPGIPHTRHWAALSLQADLPTQPRHHRGSSCRIPQISCCWDQETVPVISQCRCDQQFQQISKEFYSLCLALILSPPMGHYHS